MNRPRLKTLQPRVGRLDTRTAMPGPKVADSHYRTPEHETWRKLVIDRARGQCEWVEDGIRCGRAEPRMFADHIKEITDGGAKLDPANGQCLCGRHHTIKTAEQRAKRAATPV